MDALVSKCARLGGLAKMDGSALLGYALISFLYIISPGPAIFLAISNGLSASIDKVLLSSFGNIVGLLLLSGISWLGLGVLLTTSAKLFLVMKLLGAGYLIYLGIKQFRNAGVSLFTSPQKSTQDRKAGAYFVEGFLMAATNPKAIIFFIAFFPLFLDHKAAMLPQFFTMTGIFMALSFISLASYGLLASVVKGCFSSPQKMKCLHRVTGGLFIGMGVGLLQIKNT